MTHKVCINKIAALIYGITVYKDLLTV